MRAETPAAAVKTMRVMSDIVREYIYALDDRASGGKASHQSSGFSLLDSAIPAWLHDGHLIVVAGRPSMGKSAFVQQIAEHVASNQRTALFIALEMSSYEIAERAVSRLSGVSLPKLKSGILSQADWAAVTAALERLNPLPILVDDAQFDIDGLMAKTRAAAAALEQRNLPPLGCIVVDYIQLVSGAANATATRAIEIGSVTRGLKQLAAELRVPVIGVSQINRSVESRAERRPTLADLRESGAIEQDADLVLMLYRDEYYNPKSLDKNIAEIIVAKNRHGWTGTVKLPWDGARVMFGGGS